MAAIKSMSSIDTWGEKEPLLLLNMVGIQLHSGLPLMSPHLGCTRCAGTAPTWPPLTLCTGEAGRALLSQGRDEITSSPTQPSLIPPW